MRHDEYNAIEAVRSTQLIRIDHCPASFWIELEETKSLKDGRAFHTFMLQPEIFSEEYMIALEAFDSKTKEGKAKKQHYEEQAAGREVIKLDDAEMFLGMQESIKRHPTAMDWLEKSTLEQAEVCRVWTDEETGIKCKTLADWICYRENMIINLKTATKIKGGAHDRAVNKSISSYDYDVSAAMQLEGFKATGNLFSKFGFIVVEKEPPYKVGIFEIMASWVESGHQEFHRLLRTLKQCQELEQKLIEKGAKPEEARITAFPAYQYAGAQTLEKPEYYE